MNGSAITWNEMIGPYDEETSFNEKKTTCKKNLYFTCIFIKYYGIIESCYYLLLFYKISNKTKRFITISIHK